MRMSSLWSYVAQACVTLVWLSVGISAGIPAAVMLPDLSKPCWCNHLWVEQQNHALTSQSLT